MAGAVAFSTLLPPLPPSLSGCQQLASRPALPSAVLRRQYYARCAKFLGSKPSLVCTVQPGNQKCTRCQKLGSKCFHVRIPALCSLVCHLLNVIGPSRLCKRGKALQHLAASVAAGRGGAWARAKLRDGVTSFSHCVNCATAWEQEQQLSRKLTAYQVSFPVVSCDNAGLGLGLGSGSRLGSRLGLGLGMVLGS